MSRLHVDKGKEQQLYGARHARMQRKNVYRHFAAFAAVHIAFIFLFGLVPASELPSGSYLLHMKDWILTKKIGFYRNDTANFISGVWTTVLIIHAVGWGLWYTLFPKRKSSDIAHQDVERNGGTTEREKREITIDRAKEKSEVPTPAEESKGKDTISVGRAWLYTFIGGLMEIFWATSFKTGSIGLLTIIAIIVSFELLIRAAKKIAIGTVYAVFTGIGAIGTILVDMLILSEPMGVIKIVLILVLATFIAGLKFTSETGD